ncbi:MAG: Gfo/Idh/MocA family oxidoreductase [Bacillota bacterium]|nr:Gfo/Idh/MocA family oxidoreductase [Bacillota bacterium]
MGIKVGIVGTGSFVQGFIPLFKAHPLVDKIVLCDLDSEKLAANARKHQIPDVSPSLDDLLNTDVDAVVVMTQHWMHAPQAIQALKAGKHVYSAVPAGITLDEIASLVHTVKETGLVYMIGETSYYYPEAIYCRGQFAHGAFGHIVYGEAEYYHDWDHGLYDVAKWRGGKSWMKFAGSPPMHYPTHSTSMIISVTGSHMTNVSCLGFIDRSDDGIYQKEANIYENEFSNQTALFRMSDGSMCRINEFRRIGHPGTVRLSLFGTEGSFEHNTQSAVWVTKDAKQKKLLDEQLTCRNVSAKSKAGRSVDMDLVTAAAGTYLGTAPIQPVDRLPETFIGLPNGHCGSHQFLVDDFVKACVSGMLPPNNIWDAARYVIPGLVAHESAKKDGLLLDIPDFGDAPL